MLVRLKNVKQTWDILLYINANFKRHKCKIFNFPGVLELVISDLFELVDFFQELVYVVYSHVENRLSWVLLRYECFVLLLNLSFVL